MNSANNQLTIEHLTETIAITDIGVFIWNLSTDHVIYSKEWAHIVGYELDELDDHLSTWERMVLPEDLPLAETALANYLEGKVDAYEVEFRMVRKDGSIIWGHDKGKITEYDEQGNPLILCGVLQDITSIKLTEEQLRESTNILNLATEAAEFGTWDWDVINSTIAYNDEYLNMLGYTQDDIEGTLDEWERMNHPEDLPLVSQLLDDFIAGKIDVYECDIRMLHKNGTYIWTKDVGKIMSRDESGNVTRVIGGHLNIDDLKNSQNQLRLTLEELNKHQSQLEDEITQRTKALVEQDKLLLTVNDISHKLLTLTDEQSFDETLLDCLESLATAYNMSEINLSRFAKIKGYSFIYITHLYKAGHKIAYDISGLEAHVDSFVDQVPAFSIMESGSALICYDFLSEAFRYNIEEKKVITDFMAFIPETWCKYIQDNFDNNRSLLLSPIYLYNELFGFVSTGSHIEGLVYTETQQNMLLVSGNLFANAQKKHEMDEQLRQAHEEALLSSQAKTSFLANMSHEIRTPLNAILGMSEIVLRESIGRATEEYAQEIKNASESLLSIINDILDISKIESGKLEIIEDDYYISSLLNDIINISKVRVATKPLIFTTYIDCSIPARLKGDEIRIKQILLNLLSNAIKFTHEGHIEFRATSHYDNGLAVLEFTITDTGMGIKEEDMDRLFMQFERMDTKKNRNIEGTGLGLAITKQLCQMMGGNITVKSIIGQGSVFTVNIPQSCQKYEPIAPILGSPKVLVYEAREFYAESIKQVMANIEADCTVCSSQSQLQDLLSNHDYDFLFIPAVHLTKVKNLQLKMDYNFTIVLMVDPGDTSIYRDALIVNLPLSCLQLAGVFGHELGWEQEESGSEHFIAPKAKVLVVDDNEINLMVAEGLMEPYKFTIDTAADGFQAVEMVQNSRYDLVFMDHMMPGMDGIDATAAIRKLEGNYYQDLPIIALTANALVGAKELFINEGMSDFLAKPIELQKLDEILLQWIPKDKQIAAKKQITPIINTDLTINIEGLNADYGLKLIGGKLDDYLDILSSYYHDGLNKVTTLSAAFEQRNLDDYRLDTHTLKSASASIGAFGVSEKAKALEHAAIKADWPYIESHNERLLVDFTNLLAALNDYLKVSIKPQKGHKNQGDPALLQANIVKLEQTIADFDIDLSEALLLEVMAFNWQDNINNLLQQIFEALNSFEYYQAKSLLDILKTCFS